MFPSASMCVCLMSPVETNDIRAKVESVSKGYSLATKNYSKIIATLASFLLPMSPISHRVRTYRSMRISDPCTSKKKTQIGTCNQSSGSSRSLMKDLMKEMVTWIPPKFPTKMLANKGFLDKFSSQYNHNTWQSNKQHWFGLGFGNLSASQLIENNLKRK